MIALVSSSSPAVLDPAGMGLSPEIVLGSIWAAMAPFTPYMAAFLSIGAAFWVLGKVLGLFTSRTLGGGGPLPPSYGNGHVGRDLRGGVLSDATSYFRGRGVLRRYESALREDHARESGSRGHSPMGWSGIFGGGSGRTGSALSSSAGKTAHIRGRLADAARANSVAPGEDAPFELSSALGGLLMGRRSARGSGRRRGRAK